MTDPRITAAAEEIVRFFNEKPECDACSDLAANEGAEWIERDEAQKILEKHFGAAPKEKCPTCGLAVDEDGRASQ